MEWDLRRGRWQQALADVEHVDAVIVDAPYSARTHGGHDRQVRRCIAEGDRLGMRELAYTALGEQDVRAFVKAWSPRCRGWFVTITDHVLAPVWAAALEDAGRYVFAPLPWVAPGSRRGGRCRVRT
jgi:hypothetical protein